MPKTYINFDLELRRGATGYVAAVLNSPYGEPSNEFEIPFTEEERHVLAGGAEEDSRGLHLIKAPQQSAALTPDVVGERLFAAAFDRNMYIVFQQSLEAARTADSGLRLRLRLGEDVPELAGLPWEFLSNAQGDHIALSTETPVIRYVKLDYARPVPQVEPPLTVLAVASSPADVPALDIEREYALLEQALSQTNEHQLKLERLPEATITALNDRLRSGDIHVIHFIGHGYFDEGREIGGLVLEDEQGLADFVDADQLRVLFENRTALRMLFLNACEGAHGDRGNVFAGTAQRLVQRGMPIVLAMQYKISDEAAIQFGREFYEAIAAGYPVDMATADARRKVRGVGNDREWATPVLFSRLDDNDLVKATPVRLLMEAMEAEERARSEVAGGGYLPLSVDVIHTNGGRQVQILEKLGADYTANSEFLTTILAIFNSSKDRRRSNKPLLVLLEGFHGSNKSTQLLQLALQTMEAELESEGMPGVLPLYLDLSSDLSLKTNGRVASIDDIVALIRAKLDSYGPDLTLDEIELLLERKRIRLRILFDHLDTLAAWERVDFFKQIQGLIVKYPDNDYVLAVTASMVEGDVFEDLDVHRLAIQPLIPRRIRHFVQSLPKIGGSLLAQMTEKQLFDLAANPGVLVKLTRDFLRGRKLRPRTQTMGRLLRDGVATIPSDHGMRSHAEKLLVQLAWAMQSERKATWPIARAFALMVDVRGNRGYRLEDLLEALEKAGLLISVGDEELSFVQRQMQTYCAAAALFDLPDRARRVDDIIATLGRPTRRRWWGATLVFFTGLLASRRTESGRIAELEQLLEDMVYSVNLLHHDQVFLAVHCLLEAKQQGYARLLGDGLAHQVIEALVWRLHGRHEPNAANRAASARLLGRLAGEFPDSNAGPMLVRVAYAPVHVDLEGNEIYDRSNVRLAAAVALLRIDGEKRRQFMRGCNPALIRLYQDWEEREVGRLISMLEGGDVGMQGIAALALGETYAQLEAMTRGQVATQESKKQAKMALDALMDSFGRVDAMADATCWAVAHALTYLEDEKVYDLLLKDFLTTALRRKSRPPRETRAQYRGVAYLIGRLRLQEPCACDFLVDVCLGRSSDPALWQIAIEALGWLADPGPGNIYKDRLEQIAVGQFEIFPIVRPLRNEKIAESLQFAAILALATIGDEKSIASLRDSLRHRIDQPVILHSSLTDAFFQTSEEIYWRLQQAR